jgi:hypothetical protein
MQIDLEAERHAAIARVGDRHLGRISALNVSPAAIAELGRHFPPFGVGQAVDIGRGLYEPGNGPEHLILFAYEDGAHVDSIALRTDAPTRWMWRIGQGWALGADWLNRLHWDPTPTPIFATPIDWLRGGGQGICILDWSSDEIRRLALVDAIETDANTGKRILGILSKPRRLPWLVMRKAVQRAA